MLMFDKLLSIFQPGSEPSEKTSSADDIRLACAALLVHMISIDGQVDEDERTRLKSVLSDYFSLSETETGDLIAAAQKADAEAVDLYGFTHVLKRDLDDEGRMDVIEMLWKMVYADGEVHEFEDNMVWRVAELLGVSRKDRIRLKKRVEVPTDR